MRISSFGAHYTQKPTKIGLLLSAFIHSNILRFLRKRINFSGSRLLEIGPGRGIWVENLKKMGVDYYAIEGCKEFSQNLVQGLGENRVSQEMCPPIAFPDKCFDVVILFHFLEHMAGVNEAALLTQEIRRVLKPAGIVVVGCPDILHWKHYFFDADYTHNFATSQRRIRGLLIDNDFSVVLCKGYNVFFNYFDYIIHFIAYYFPVGLFPASFRERLFNLKYTLLLNSIVIAKNTF